MHINILHIKQEMLENTFSCSQLLWSIQLNIHNIIGFAWLAKTKELSCLFYLNEYRHNFWHLVCICTWYIVYESTSALTLILNIGRYK